MSLRLYDTATRELRDFVPLTPGKVGIYHCGLTVQAAPHIGHIRKEVVFDVLRRWLEYSGYDVTIIANITDIDDKILDKAAETGRAWWEIAYENELSLEAAYEILGCIPATYQPRATGHITEMTELIEELLQRGHAYVAPDGSGDVYFEVRSWPDYGALSGQRLDEMEPAADADERGKRDPRDFAVWKGHKEDEPHTASWPAPWGRGRPGWHIECSAMAGKYLGDRFDIHGGGIDLRFPHHENELAQSQAAGRDFAALWMHNGWVTTAGEKMSKSLGNSLLVSEVVRRIRPIELRYYLLSAHYRSHVDYSEEALQEAGAAFRRIEGFVQRAAEVIDDDQQVPLTVPEAFAAAMDDDLSVPQALGIVFDTVREGNTLLADGRHETDSPEERTALIETWSAVRGMLAVLGIDPLGDPWTGLDSMGASGDRLRGVVDSLVAMMLDQRGEARQERDFARADAIRDRLKAAGIMVEDNPSGPRWELDD